MKGQFLVNNNTISYLIHGQPLCLQYQTTGCWFVVIAYNNGDSLFNRLFFRKSNGKFETVTNVYSPEITLWGIGWGIKKLFHKRLQINFFNTRTQMMYPKTPELAAIPSIVVHKPNLLFKTPPIAITSATQPRLLADPMHILTYDDYLTYKENQPRINSIN